MSGFETIAPLAMSGLGLASSLGQSSAQQSAAEAQAEAQAQQNQLILQRQAQEDENQRNLLEQAAATQRARTGAMGVDGGGSADAILAGMADNTADNIAAGDQSAQLRLRPVRSQDNLLSSAGLGRSGLSVFSSFYDGLG